MSVSNVNVVVRRSAEAPANVFVDIITIELQCSPALVLSYSLRRSFEALAGYSSVILP